MACALAATAVRAESEPLPSGEQRALYRAWGEDPASLAQAEALLRGYAETAGLRLQDASQPEPNDELHQSPASGLQVLTRVENALLEARELSAQFREAAALSVLAGVESELLAALELPGAQAFLAEVYVQIGLCAALLGQDGLAETSLTRALSLDPGRRVEAAEAPPTTLALARRIARNHDVLASSDNPLQLSPRETRVWLDGVRVEGNSLHARAGLHVLVAQAAGYRPYASLLTLEPGRRPNLQITLSASPAHEARSALLTSPTPEAATAPAMQLAGSTQAPVFLLQAGSSGRALVQRCESRCQLFGLETMSPHQRRFTDQGAAYAWLQAVPAPQAPLSERPPVWKRWQVWLGGAALVAAGVATALLLREEPAGRSQRQLEIDPGMPPP